MRHTHYECDTRLMPGFFFSFIYCDCQHFPKEQIHFQAKWKVHIAPTFTLDLKNSCHSTCPSTETVCLRGNRGTDIWWRRIQWRCISFVAQRKGKSNGAGSLLNNLSCPFLSESPILFLLFFSQVEDFPIPEKWSCFLPAGTVYCPDSSVSSLRVWCWSSTTISVGPGPRAEFFLVERSWCMGVCRVIVQ